MEKKIQLVTDLLLELKRSSNYYIRVHCCLCQLKTGYLMNCKT